jgi:hypothetical protein
MNFQGNIYENRTMERMTLNSRTKFPPKKSGSGCLFISPIAEKSVFSLQEKLI